MGDVSNYFYEYAQHINLGIDIFEDKFVPELKSLKNDGGDIKLTDYQIFTSSHFLLDQVQKMLLFWETGFGKTIECVYLMKNVFELYPQWKIFLFVKSSLAEDPWRMTINKFLPDEIKRHIIMVHYDLRDSERLFLLQQQNISKSYRIFYVFDEAHDFIKKLIPKENKPERRLTTLIAPLITSMNKFYNKTLFMSATPMNDNPLEFNYMLNFLRNGNIKLQEAIFDENVELINSELLKNICIGLTSFKKRSDIDVFKNTEPSETLAGKNIIFIDLLMSDHQTGMYKEVSKIELQSKSRGFRTLRKLISTLAFELLNKKDLDEEIYLKALTEKNASFMRMINSIKFSDKFIDDFKNNRILMKEESALTKNLKFKIENDFDLTSKLVDEVRQNEINDLVTLHNYSSVYVKTCQIIKQSKGKCIVFQSFVTFEGIKTFSDYFNKFNISHIEFSQRTKKNRPELVNQFNSPENNFGDVTKCCILSMAGTEGISFKYITDVIITIQPWSGYEQIFGRAIRLNSHDGWKLEDKKVNFHILINHPNDPIFPSVDLEILNLVKLKAKRSNQIYNALKDSSIEAIHDMYPDVESAKEQNFYHLTHVVYDLEDFNKRNISVLKQMVPILFSYNSTYETIIEGFLDEDNNQVFKDQKYVGNLQIKSDNTAIFKIINGRLVYLVKIINNIEF